MITGSPVPESAGWVPIPIQTARDPRLNRRALGLLVELLSYPPGWDNSADRLSAKRGEGRDATRAAMAALEDAGYVIHLRYRAERGRWFTASFAGSAPEVARSLADAWIAEHPNTEAKQKPSSDRRTGFQASENQASADQSSENQAFNTYKTDSKNDSKTVEQDRKPDDANTSSRLSGAYAPDTGDAVASPREEDRSSHAEPGTAQQQRVGRTRKPSLADHLAGMDSDDLDEMLIELECSRGGIVDWALPIAREALRMPQDADPHDEIGGRLAVKVLALALPSLYKQGGLPTAVDDALADFEWPYEFDWYSEPAPRKPRERTHTDYAYAKKGVDTEKILNDVYAAVTSADRREITELTAAFRKNRPNIFQECTRQAIKQLELTEADADNLGAMRLALKYGLLHYSEREKWPTWLLPASVRPTGTEKAAA